MAAHFKLDTKGIREVLTSEWMRGEVDAAAERIADGVRDQVPDDVPVVVDHYTTDRDAAAVTITDVRGLGLQAREGVLTRAAAAAGLEVRLRG